MKTPLSIRDYIRNEIFARRAQEGGIIVIYDPGRRYREVALSMVTDQCRVIDASLSVIEQRGGYGSPQADEGRFINS